MAQIAPTAIVDPAAEIGDGVIIEDFVVIRGAVKIGSGTIVRAHSLLQGPAVIGKNGRIGPGAYIGLEPQSISFRENPANPTWLVIGDDVVMREACRINRASHPGIERATRIGNGCFIMGAAHVGHDCIVGNNVILADSVLLGGHCRVAERAFLGGGCTVHQFVSIGRLAMIGGNEAFTHDVPPFAALRYGRLKGYNAIGCRRAGMDAVAITAIRAVYLRLRTRRTMNAALDAVRREVPDLPEVRELLEFIHTSRRGIVPSQREPIRIANKVQRRRIVKTSRPEPVDQHFAP